MSIYPLSLANTFLSAFRLQLVTYKVHKTRVSYYIEYDTILR